MAVAATITVTGLASAAERGHPAGKSKPAAADLSPASAPLPALTPQEVAALSDEQFCGVMRGAAQPAARSEAERREEELRCPQPGLPCGPVPASAIGSGAGDPQEDLDGDGAPDLTHAGRTTTGRPISFGVIYRWTPLGFVLVDYQAVDRHADPQVAQVAHRDKYLTPIVRDGYDLPMQEGRTLSIARLRRFDGQRFRTLLTFCAHRREPVPDGGVREAHNRLDFADLDRDGVSEVVISGFQRPVVYKVAGLAMTEDTALTTRYRDHSPQEVQARALRAEAAQLFAQGEWRRAAALLGKAHGMAPYQVETSMRYAESLLKLGQAAEAVEVLKAAERSAGSEAGPSCLLGAAYRALDDDDEQGAWERCLQRGPDAAQRKLAEARLAALRAQVGAGVIDREARSAAVNDGSQGPPDGGGQAPRL